MTTKINNFVKKLALIETSDMLFNPYNELSKSLDDRTAPGIRQQNLRLYLNSYVKFRTEMLWVCITPSYQKAKRSGVPLVSFSMFRKIEDILDTSKHFEKTSKRRRELSNTIVSSTLWCVADELNINPIIWPVLPFYPHKRDDPEIWRKPTKKEIIKHGWFIREIINVYKPKYILSIGKNTKEALALLGIKTKHLQHPRRGKKVFKKSIKKLIKLK